MINVVVSVSNGKLKLYLYFAQTSAEATDMSEITRIDARCMGKIFGRIKEQKRRRQRVNQTTGSEKGTDA
jgi:K+/H+ antiporter YhaU regulatory subunit KhtT